MQSLVSVLMVPFMKIILYQIVLMSLISTVMMLFLTGLMLFTGLIIVRSCCFSYIVCMVANTHGLEGRGTGPMSKINFLQYKYNC